MEQNESVADRFPQTCEYNNTPEPAKLTTIVQVDEEGTERIKNSNRSDEIATTSEDSESFESPEFDNITECITGLPIPDGNDSTTGTLSMQKSSIISTPRPSCENSSKISIEQQLYEISQTSHSKTLSNLDKRTENISRQITFNSEEKKDGNESLVINGKDDVRDTWQNSSMIGVIENGIIRLVAEKRDVGKSCVLQSSTDNEKDNGEGDTSSNRLIRSVSAEGIPILREENIKNSEVLRKQSNQLISSPCIIAPRSHADRMPEGIETNLRLTKPLEVVQQPRIQSTQSFQGDHVNTKTLHEPPIVFKPQAQTQLIGEQQIPMYTSNASIIRKRAIQLRLEQEVKTDRGGEGFSKYTSKFLKFRRPRVRSIDDCADTPLKSLGSHLTRCDSVPESPEPASPYINKRSSTLINHGSISISWYDGTSTVELQDHVRKSLCRKLDLDPSQKVNNIRLIDESVIPSEEIVLSAHIPTGSMFLLKFAIDDLVKALPKDFISKPPDSPSAAPDPEPPMDVMKLQKQINMILELEEQKKKKKKERSKTTALRSSMSSISDDNTVESNKISRRSSLPQELSSNDLVAEHLRQLNEMLSRANDHDKEKFHTPKKEKRQVVFVIANYLVLFLSIIAISAEIHERAPIWMDHINNNLSSVQNCAVDRDTLFECVSNGDFSGLIASIMLWATKSVSTKQIFLLGFDSSHKLWTVVYEAGISSVCWGASYMFIRRGLNPDTRENFLYKYWKDAIYGSLAGFNAAFLKAVLKNLIPQDQVLDALEHRQLKIFGVFSRIFDRKKS